MNKPRVSYNDMQPYYYIRTKEHNRMSTLCSLIKRKFIHAITYNAEDSTTLSGRLERDILDGTNIYYDKMLTTYVFTQ
jgi:hypothetical protein